MTHLSPSDFNYKIAGSNVWTMATVIPTRNNGTVINEIAKYYDVAVNGFGKLMFLQ
jgi:hypothetical protein